jgi:hypothetical protein
MIRKFNIAFIVVIFFLPSCYITDQAKTIQIELLRPGILNLPDSLISVSVFSNNSLYNNNCYVIYESRFINRIDSSITCSFYANKCLETLADSLKARKYFKEVNFHKNDFNNYNDTLQLADINIFLNYFNFRESMVTKYPSTLYTIANLSWNFVLKNDSNCYLYNQIDTLFYDQEHFHKYKKNWIINTFIEASVFLGNTIATKLQPNWQTVERMYYKSNNPNMLSAEKYFLANDYLKAAEIWNKETQNKNQRIATKASFNMALICELEGKPELSIDWLIKSFSYHPSALTMHSKNCQLYIKLLANRKKEINQLQLQMRNSDLKL